MKGVADSQCVEFAGWYFFGRGKFLSYLCGWERGHIVKFWNETLTATLYICFLLNLAMVSHQTIFHNRHSSTLNCILGYWKSTNSKLKVGTFKLLFSFDFLLYFVIVTIKKELNSNGFQFLLFISCFQFIVLSLW